MLAKIDSDKHDFAKFHESARNFQNSELLQSSKHIFEPNTPIIVEASQILEDSQSQVKLRGPTLDQLNQNSSPVEKTHKDIVVEKLDSSLKRLTDVQENQVNKEFKAQFEAVAKNNNE